MIDAGLVYKLTRDIQYADEKLDQLTSFKTFDVYISNDAQLVRVLLVMVPGSVPGPSRKNQLIGVTDDIDMVTLIAFIRYEI